MNSHELDQIKMAPAYLEREWRITIQTPIGGVDAVLDALGDALPLKQGAYDNCAYVRGGGSQRFRALEGSHAGNEGTVQVTDAAEIVISIPPDKAMLNKVFETTFAVHVNEEPTIHVEELWGCRSNYVDDKDNPNRYWNRPDSEQIHGNAVNEET